MASNYLIQREPPLEYDAILELSDIIFTDDLASLEIDTGCVSSLANRAAAQQKCSQTSYTFKTLAIGCWALRQACSVLPPAQVQLSPPSVRQRLFEHLLVEIALWGGDAETCVKPCLMGPAERRYRNCNVAAFFLGAYFGRTGLPPQWVLEHGQWLADKVHQACTLLSLYGPNEDKVRREGAVSFFEWRR